MKLTIVFTILLGLLETQGFLYPSRIFHENKGNRKVAVRAKTYTVNLDTAPNLRWAPILKDFKAEELLNIIDSLLETYVKKKELIELAELIANDLENFLPQPYAEELKGIAEFYNVKIGDIVLANLAYDVSAWDTDGFRACTSIVTIDKNGGLLHARNLDYASANGLRNITVEAEFIQNGKVLFVATTYAGYVGILTAAKPGAFSLSANERDTGYWWENLAFALKKSWPTLMFSRQVMMEATDFKSAVSMLVHSKTIAPIYFIVGGTKNHEAVIIVRDRWGAVNVTTMTDTHGWFILETNYDPWNKPPASDDRRDPGVKAMVEVGRKNMDPENLYKVLSTYPVFNVDTTYTTVMSAANMSVYHTMIRWDHPT